MLSRLGPIFLGVCIAVGVADCAAAAADDQQPVATRVYGMTPGRLSATIDAVVGLMSVILAGRSLRSSGRIGYAGQKGAVVAMVMGLIVIGYALFHLSMFTGDIGTGGGRAGAFVAIALGVASIVLAGIALSRSRRTE